MPGRKNIYILLIVEGLGQMHGPDDCIPEVEICRIKATVQSGYNVCSRCRQGANFFNPCRTKCLGLNCTRLTLLSLENGQDAAVILLVD